MIRFENVSKRYGGKVVLDNLSFEIPQGQFVVLIGPSGCGKTTTLKCINRLIEPDKGRIYVDGRDIAKENPAKLRRSIGYVIQQIGLFPNMTIEQNIAVVPRLLKYDAPRCDKIVRELLELVNMPYEENAKKYPAELSGGQQQRIGVLRALAASPPTVLMDEPFGALDPVTRDSLQEEVKKIQQKLNKTIVFVTHDMGEALLLADTIVFMNEGKIEQMASPEEMLRNPASNIVKSFMGRHVPNNGHGELTAADFMKKRALTVKKNRKVVECVDLMSRREINSVIVVNDDSTFAGVVSIDSIHRAGKTAGVIGDLISTDVHTVYGDTPARQAFDELLDSSDNYVVVLNADDTVAGIITRTSTARAMGDALWGDVI